MTYLSHLISINIGLQYLVDNYEDKVTLEQLGAKLQRKVLKKIFVNSGTPGAI